MNVEMEILEDSQKFFEKTLALNPFLCNNHDCKEIHGYGKEKPTVYIGKLDGAEVIVGTEYPYTETLG